jgi:hypothetical protein
MFDYTSVKVTSLLVIQIGFSQNLILFHKLLYVPLKHAKIMLHKLTDIT